MERMVAVSIAHRWSHLMKLTWRNKISSICLSTLISGNSLLELIGKYMFHSSTSRLPCCWRLISLHQHKKMVYICIHVCNYHTHWMGQWFEKLVFTQSRNSLPDTELGCTLLRSQKLACWPCHEQIESTHYPAPYFHMINISKVSSKLYFHFFFKNNNFDCLNHEILLAKLHFWEFKQYMQNGSGPVWLIEDRKCK